MISVYLAATHLIRRLDLHLLHLEGPMTQRHAAAPSASNDHHISIEDPQIQPSHRFIKLQKSDGVIGEDVAQYLKGSDLITVIAFPKRILQSMELGSNCIDSAVRSTSPFFQELYV